MTPTDRVRSHLRGLVRRFPALGRALARLPLAGGARDAATYWEQRYRSGGDSGHGSEGALARYKAQVLNELVARHQIASVLELGCGDGRQLELAEYPEYRGLDIAPTAVARCQQHFSHDPTKRFAVYEPDRFDPAAHTSPLALSIDVLYHLVEDEVFDRHLRHLFASATQRVVIYSSDEDRLVSAHVRHRHFTPWIQQNAPEWRLEETLENPLRMEERGGVGSDARFFVYRPASEIR